LKLWIFLRLLHRRSGRKAGGMTNDYINSLFEVLAGFMLLLHCRHMLVDKSVKGTSIIDCNIAH